MLKPTTAGKLLLAIFAALVLSACAGGDRDTDTPPAVVIGSADRACRDAAGKDVVCP